MTVRVIDHNVIRYFEARVAYARMRRAQGIVVCAAGHEIPIAEYPAWCAAYREQ